MAERGGRAFWVLGGVVMLLLFAAAATFFSVVVSVWLTLFAHAHFDAASIGVRLAFALAAMVAVAGLMELRRRL